MTPNKLTYAYHDDIIYNSEKNRKQPRSLIKANWLNQ